MALEVNLNTLFEAVILAVLLYGIRGMMAVRDTSIKMQSWAEAHDKQDDERYRDLLQRIGGHSGSI